MLENKLTPCNTYINKKYYYDVSFCLVTITNKNKNIKKYIIKIIKKNNKKITKIKNKKYGRIQKSITYKIIYKKYGRIQKSITYKKI